MLAHLMFDALRSIEPRSSVGLGANILQQTLKRVLEGSAREFLSSLISRVSLSELAVFKFGRLSYFLRHKFIGLSYISETVLFMPSPNDI